MDKNIVSPFFDSRCSSDKYEGAVLRLTRYIKLHNL